MEYTEVLETILHSFVSFSVLLFEYIGVFVITFAGIQGIVNYVRQRPDTRLLLAKGLAMGLEFKLGSEILRTVVVRSLSEIYIVAGIIALRAVLTILIHWEIKNEENENEMYHKMQQSGESEAEMPSVGSVLAASGRAAAAVFHADQASAGTKAEVKASADSAHSAADTGTNRAKTSEEPLIPDDTEASQEAAKAEADQTTASGVPLIPDDAEATDSIRL